MPDLHSFEKVVYEQKLSELIASSVVKTARLVRQGDGASGNQFTEWVVLRWPLDDFWSYCAHEHWQKDVYFELLLLVPYRGY